MRRTSYSNKMDAAEQDSEFAAPKRDFRAEFAASKKNPSQSLSFAFSASSFSLSSKDSRNEQKVKKSLRSVIQKPVGGGQRRKSDTTLMRSSGGSRRPSVGSAPSVFVNPPTFALARGDKAGSVRQTMGVPMIGIEEDTAPTGKKKNKAQVGYKVNKNVVAGVNSKNKKAGVVRGGMFASPPAMSITKGGTTSRARRTLGVPMV